MSYCAHCGSEVGADAAACAACGYPPSSHPPSPAVSGTASKFPWIIVIFVALVVGVAMMGMLAAIIIPNLHDALHKAKQKRTVADIRQVGTAWMSWRSDEMGTAAAGSSTVYDLGGLDQILTAAELDRQLRGGSSGASYIAEVPATDGWGHDLEYRQAADLFAEPFMAIRSPGRDGRATGSSYELGSFAATSYDEDIVWVDGFFVRYPEGAGR